MSIFLSRFLLLGIFSALLDQHLLSSCDMLTRLKWTALVVMLTLIAIMFTAAIAFTPPKLALDLPTQS